MLIFDRDKGKIERMSNTMGRGKGLYGISINFCFIFSFPIIVGIVGGRQRRRAKKLRNQ